MGQTLSTSAMIDQLMYRCPFLVIRQNGLFQINRSARYWNSKASYSFNCTTNISAFVFAPNVTVATAPSDMDMGQDFYIYTSGATPYPIRRVELNEYGIKGIRGNLMSNQNIPDHYVVAGRTVQIYPGIPGGITLSAFYHIITPVLTDSTSSFSLFPDNFDDVILDFAEAETKRENRIIGWEPLMARVTDQAKGLVDQYRTNTKLPEGSEAALRTMQDTNIVKQT